MNLLVRLVSWWLTLTSPVYQTSRRVADNRLTWLGPLRAPVAERINQQAPGFSPHSVHAFVGLYVTSASKVPTCYELAEALRDRADEIEVIGARDALTDPRERWPTSITFGPKEAHGPLAALGLDTATKVRKTDVLTSPVPPPHTSTGGDDRGHG